MGIRSGILLAALVAGVAVGAAAQPVKERSPATESLFLAIRTNDMGAVKRSLLAGADVEAENDEGRTSIDVAIDRGRFDIAHYLLAWRKQQTKPKAAVVAAAPPVVAEPSPEPTPQIMPPVGEPPSVLSPTPAAPVTAQPLAPTPAPLETPPPVAATPMATPEKPTETAAAPTPAAASPVAPLPPTGKITPPGEAAPRQEGFFESLASFFSGAASSETAADDAGNPQSSPPKPVARQDAPAVAPTTAAATAVTTAAKPATAKPAPASEPPVRDSVLDYIAGVLAEAQRANTPAAPTPAATLTAVAAPAPPPNPAAAPAATPTPAAAAPEKPAGDGNNGELLGRITEFFTVTPKRPPPQPASAGRAPAPPPGEAPPAHRATVEPWLGDNQRLGKPRPADGSGACLHKSALPATFCIEAVRWPATIADAFQVQTRLTRGGQVIVRYDDDVATQFHVVFPTANFRAIVDYFSTVLGPPGDTPERTAAVIGKPDRKNHTARWLGPRDAAGGDDVLLEVREIDDLRWSSPPDPTHGVVRLLRVGDDMMFKHVSWSDFLLVKIHQARE